MSQVEIGRFTIDPLHCVFPANDDASDSMRVPEYLPLMMIKTDSIELLWRSHSRNYPEIIAYSPGWIEHNGIPSDDDGNNCVFVGIRAAGPLSELIRHARDVVAQVHSYAINDNAELPDTTYLDKALEGFCIDIIEETSL